MNLLLSRDFGGQVADGFNFPCMISRVLCLEGLFFWFLHEIDEFIIG